MMRQYQAIKQEYPDCLLLFRLGDFYELFCEDAKIGAQLLGIVLTSRDKKIPMAGIPYHAVEQYLPKLVQAGHKVAICEQVGQVEKGNKLVEREVIRIVTPGTVLDDKSLERKKNNYLVAVEWGSKQIGLALVDLSTAEFKTTQLSDPQTLLDEITRLQPAECLLAPAVYNDPAKLGQLKQAGAQNLVAEHRWEGWQGQAQRTLLDHFRLRSLRSLDWQTYPLHQTAAAGCVLLQYFTGNPKKRRQPTS